MKHGRPAGRVEGAAARHERQPPHGAAPARRDLSGERMFYEPSQGHGLPHNPFKACVVPRPIGWVSTIGPEGANNLAPYSFFNAVADTPPMVMFSSNGVHPHGAKDSADNAARSGEFVVNVATWDLRHTMNASSAPVETGVDEFVLAGLTAAPSRIVSAPRVAETPVNLECRTHQVVELPCAPGGRNVTVFGEVVGVHIDESVLTPGSATRITPSSMRSSPWTGPRPMQRPSRPPAGAEPPTAAGFTSRAARPRHLDRTCAAEAGCSIPFDR
jgi:flavin reductase (DIM6/NTAB) family NADH-FMN oxidoreductase RutF